MRYSAFIMPDPTQALYVRLPQAEHQRLQRAATALGTNKKALVSSLVAAYVDPDTSEGLDRLRAVASERRVTVDLPEQGMAVGRHAFTPAPPTEVLTAAEAAELLQVEEAEVTALADRGELPARRIGSHWRFSRTALLAWLGAAV
jgi:excisionase family DNA binding protein